MSDIPPTTEFVDRVNRNADSAAADLDRRYRERLCALVQREMARCFRAREDPEDVVQTVFRTYFRRAAKGEFHIECSSDLWALLTTIAHHKILKHAEYHRAKKRTPKAETQLPDGNQAVAGNEPEPCDVAVVTDLVEKTLHGLDGSFADVFRLRLRGCEVAEIAKQLGTKPNVVRYKLQRIRDRLGKMSPKPGC